MRKIQLLLLLCLLVACSDKKPIKIGLPIVFSQAFELGTLMHLKGNPVLFEPVKLNAIDIQSGQLVTGDPKIQQIAYTQTFPIGRFPIDLAFATFKEKRVIAFLRIRFSDQPVLRWTMALRPGQSMDQLNHDQYFGVKIEDDVLFLADAKNYMEWKSRIPSFLVKFNRMTNYSHINVSPNQQWVMVKPGDGKGIYAAYIGYDKSGKVATFLLDFNIVPWYESR